MKFVKYFDDHLGETVWWCWEVDTMFLVNFNGGGFHIDENADYWLRAEVYEYDSWHTLWKQTGFCPWEISTDGDCYFMNGWVDPYGIIWKADAHDYDAVKIAELYYGVELKYWGVDNGADYLTSRGWTKITRGAMWHYYVKDPSKQSVSRKTYYAVVKYCLKHDIEHPKHLEVSE